MRTRAAVLWGLDEPWKVEDVELDDPKRNEVMVKLTASGLCHSDEHLVTGDIPIPFPVVGGHEGAGVVEKVGEGVERVKPGDHVVLAFIPSCGRCKWCADGHANLCDLGAGIILGPQLDETYRFHADGQDVGQMCMLGTFSPYTVVPEASVIVIEDDIPLDKAALVGCGVTTGFGSAVNTGEVAPGDTVVVMGCGGIGMNAVQGARIAGAERVVAVDPVASKRELAQELGATHSVASMDEAWELVSETTWGGMANCCIITTDNTEMSHVGEALNIVGKRGKVVVTAIPHPEDTSMEGSLFEMTLYEKQIRGSLFGSSNAHAQIPRLLSLYRQGVLKLDELVTRTYTLDEINQGYDDLRSGKNVRGMIVY